MIIKVGMMLQIRNKKVLTERPYLGNGLFKIRYIGSKLICAVPTKDNSPEQTFELNLQDLQYCTKVYTAVSRK